MARRRHLSRIAVMQTLFERERRSGDCQAILTRNIAELSTESEPDVAFAETLMNGILDREDALREAIQAHAPGWTIERMDPIARCALMIGAFELKFANDAPPAVVMNECIDIAKEYGTDESGKFVNGVLNAMAKGGASS
ncbi:transcription antitermination factor NusB [Candidatus Peregrinibacteria bacterium]|nr:transcription antitermination factor NusB [Candidatus Peregrinibacteria bacterium]